MSMPRNSETELADLLQQLPPQLPERADRFACVQARVRHQRRIAATWGLGAVVILVALVPVTLHGLQHDGRSAGVPATEPTAIEPTPTDASAPPSPGATPTDIDNPEAYTSLSECPEALAFVEQPEVRQNLEKWRGTALGPQDSWYGGCPTIEELQHMLDVQEAGFKDRQENGDPWPTPNQEGQ